MGWSFCFPFSGSLLENIDGSNIWVLTTISSIPACQMNILTAASTFSQQPNILFYFFSSCPLTRVTSLPTNSGLRCRVTNLHCLSHNWRIDPSNPVWGKEIWRQWGIGAYHDKQLRKVGLLCLIKLIWVFHNEKCYTNFNLHTSWRDSKNYYWI